MRSTRTSAAPSPSGVLLDIQRLNAHECWAQMSWEARGMALALMAMPMEDEFGGTLPPETDAWRNALGLPSTRIMNTVRDRSIGMRGSRAMNELDQAWAVWLGELMRWFKPIDDAFLVENPKWLACKGRWWHPVLDWDSPQDSGVKKPRKTTRVKKTAAGVEGTSEGVNNVAAKPKVAKTARKKGSVVEPALDYPPIRLTAAGIRQHWDEPLTSELRTQLWDAGIQALGGNEKTARSMLGSLIKEFGEGPVAEAVAKLAVRASRPADPAAFLRKQVSIQAGENPRAQQARSKKSKVSL